MKILSWLIFFSCFYFTDAEAQKRKAFKVNPGEKVVEAIPKSEMYSYPEFIQGTIYFKNNSFSVAPVNYNSLFAEMQFIDPKGDTLSLNNAATIKLIIIKVDTVRTDTFYFSEGYQQLIFDQGNVKLAKKSYFDFNNREVLVGKGGGTASVGSETYNSLSASNSRLRELVAMEILTFVKYTLLYIGDRFNNFKQATKKNVLDMYGNKEREVQAYIKENKTDFSSEGDLKKLMAHFKETD